MLPALQSYAAVTTSFRDSVSCRDGRHEFSTRHRLSAEASAEVRWRRRNAEVALVFLATPKLR